MLNSFMMHSYFPPKCLDLYGGLVQENGFMISFLSLKCHTLPTIKKKYFALSVFVTEFR